MPSTIRSSPCFASVTRSSYGVPHLARKTIYLFPLSSIVTEHVVPIPTLPSTRTERVRQFLLDTDPTVAAMDSHCAKCAAEITASGFDVLFANACTTLRVTSIASLLGRSRDVARSCTEAIAPVGAMNL